VPAAHDLPRWIVVVPVKRLDRAKSRLQLPTAARTALVLAMLEDTVAAASAADGVAGVLVVTSDQAAGETAARYGLGTIPDAGRGLNAAVRRGWQAAATLAEAAQPATGFAALTGDLPALRPAELAAALVAAQPYPSAFVADRAGTGTTLLTAGPNHEAEPHFGHESRAAHLRTGAYELTGQPWDGLRCDVDVLDDLDAAMQLGVGSRTAAVVDSLRRGDDLSRAS
jgi:2-phospho-L-lactate/phosphoenolpyruvate guanylyltransferase